jgi:hypothetical protein
MACPSRRLQVAVAIQSFDKPSEQPVDSSPASRERPSQIQARVLGKYEIPSSVSKQPIGVSNARQNK